MARKASHSSISHNPPILSGFTGIDPLKSGFFVANHFVTRTHVLLFAEIVKEFVLSQQNTG
jgi:hypothetical protein